MDRRLAQPDLLSTAYLQWFEALSDRGIFATDEALIVRSWNPWLEGQTGIAASAAIGTLLYEMYPSLVERGLDRYYHDALEGQAHILSERLHKNLIPIGRHIDSIGLSEMAQSARIAPLSLDGRIVGTITVIEDVTERVVSERELRNQIAVAERARAQAEEASQLKDDFLATLSHEIRTPLNAVLGWARILRTTPTIKSRTRALEVIERNASSQLRLVEDLLDMARVMSGKLKLDVKVLDLKEVVQAAIDVVTPAAAAKNIEIVPVFESERALVNGDADRLQQAAWNVMSNAIKFTEPGGRVEVRLAVQAPNVVLTVRDSGQGISRDFLPFVFDRFRQADSSTSRRHGGLGLGLALVRQIVELHGGSVTAQSDGANRGAVFTLRVPVAKVQVATVVAPIDTGKPVTLKGISVLVVDDNHDGREMLEAALRQHGASVKTVASSSEALALLSSQRFKPMVLVSDLGMPDMDGYELLRSIRALPSDGLSDLPAIAVTAYANPEDRVRAAVAGYQLHLAKPIDPARVVASIASVVKPHPGKRRNKRPH